MGDNVNHPIHYSHGSIECIDAIESALTPEEFEGFLHGNIIKYDWRYRDKNGIEDLKKSQWYNNKLQSTIAEHDKAKRRQEIASRKEQRVNFEQRVEFKRNAQLSTILSCQYATGEFPQIEDTVLGQDNKLWFVVDIQTSNFPYIVTAVEGSYIEEMWKAQLGDARETDLSTSEYESMNTPQKLKHHMKDLKPCWLSKQTPHYPFCYIHISTRKYDLHYSR